MNNIDLLSPAVTIDPFPTYQFLREHAPVCQVEPHGLWMITRFEDVQLAMRRADIFSSTGFIEAAYRPLWLAERAHKHLFILEEDPPLHTQHRSLINKAFVHRVIEAAQPLIQTAARAQVEILRSQDNADFVSDFGYPFIGTVIGRLIGIADYLNLDEMQAVLRLMKNMTSIAPPAAEIPALEEQIVRYFHVIERVIADRMAEPKQDLITALLTTGPQGEQLDAVRARDVVDLTLTAGLDTTIGLLCNAMLSLSQLPQLFKQLKAHPELIPAFVEEQLRFNSAPHRLMRRTTMDIVLRGVTIPAGASVLIALAAANRDADQFENPDRFQLSRPNIREHVAFGYGPHVCIGAALARREVKVAIEEIVKVANGVRCPPPEELIWEPSLITHAPDTQLPIELL
jgi:cytochrome P450